MQDDISLIFWLMQNYVAQRKKVNQVFTPKNHVVNGAMYISRPEHERSLKRSVEGYRHTVVTGESGSGKSWLFWHVAAAEGWITFSANCANVARNSSLTRTIAQAVMPPGSKELTEYTQKISAKAEAFGLGGGGEAQRKYEITATELLLKAFESARSFSGEKPAVIAIDNLEAIFDNKELMAELANIILLLDDPVYAKYRIKLLIVGVPAEIIEYFQKVKNLESVANRLQEVPAVRSLSRIQLAEFIKRGFIEQLKVIISEMEQKELAAHIDHVTLGIAQRVHEYCEILGYKIEDNGWKFDPRLVKDADNRYMLECLDKSYAVIESCMNNKSTKAGRRNQVLYALEKVEATVFDAGAIEAVVRREFPNSTKDVTLAVSQILVELAENGGKTIPVLRRMPKGSLYRFADPRCLMCLRLMLAKDQEAEKVIKKTLRR